MSSRSRRWYLLPVGALVAALATSAVMRALPSSHQSAAEAQVPPKVEEAGSAAISAYRYLVFGGRVESEPLDALILDFLGRRFGVEELRVFTSRAVARLLEEGGQRSLYVRMVIPAADLPQSVKSVQSPGPTEADPVTYYPLAALHCDRFPLPEDFLEGLAEEAEAGGYRTTHSALALLFGYEQGCIDRETTRHLYMRHVEKIQEFLDTAEYAGDLYAESVALLEFMSETPVGRGYLDRLEAVQEADGSIPFAPGELSGRTHSTALALWAMLEHVEPSRPPGDWIVAPGPPAGATLTGKKAG